MKAHLPLILLVIFISCSSQSKFSKLDSTDVDLTEMEKAQILSKSILVAQKNGSHYTFKENEATSSLETKLTERLQKKSYEQISGLWGDFKDLTFIEAFKRKDGALLNIYRFEGEFEANTRIEIRATLDGKGRLAGFWIKPWEEKLYH